MGNSKQKRQKRHALRRARERLGVSITEHEYVTMTKQIQSGESECVHEQSNRVTHHRMEFGGEEFIAVYDKSRQTIVTFLTIAMYVRSHPDAFKRRDEDGPGRTQESA